LFAVNLARRLRHLIYRIHEPLVFDPPLRSNLQDPPMKDEEHNKYIAYSFFAHGAFQLLMLLLVALMFFFFISIPAAPGRPGPPAGMFAVIFGFMFVFQMLFIAPAFIAGYALLKRKSWARMAAIVAGILGAMNVPIGTATCIYSLWFFFGENWKSIYPSEDSGHQAAPRQIARGEESRWTGEYRTDETGQVKYHPVEPPDWR
jgi:hypothetical protein